MAGLLTAVISAGLIKKRKKSFLLSVASCHFSVEHMHWFVSKELVARCNIKSTEAVYLHLQQLWIPEQLMLVN